MPARPGAGAAGAAGPAAGAAAAAAGPSSPLLRRKESRKEVAARKSNEEALMVNTSVEEYSCEMCDADGEGTLYCVDCGQIHCRACSRRQHYPGTKSEFHSVEEIMPVETRGVHVITPIVDEILLVLVASFMWQYIIVGPDYIHKQMCPAMSNVQKWTSLLDSGLYTHLKSTLVEMCDNEDSFWKFFFDLWVRSTVTRTDNWFLLLSSLPIAIIGVGILIMLSPAVAAVYASAVAALHAAEMRLPPHPTLRAIERGVASINHATTYPVHAIDALCRHVHADLVLDLSDSDMPPTTRPRPRGPMDSLDRVTYWINRRLRHWWYFYEDAVSAMSKALLAVTLATFVLRFLSIWLGMGSVYLLVARTLGAPFGVRGVIEQHQRWFATTQTEWVNDIIVGVWNNGPLAGYNVPAILLALLALLYAAMVAAARYLDAEREEFRQRHEAGGGRRAPSVRRAL